MSKRFSIIQLNCAPESFALLLAEHFLSEYPWVTSARITVRVLPWERMRVDDKAHNHAFVMVPTLERFAEVIDLVGLNCSSGIQLWRNYRVNQ